MNSEKIDDDQSWFWTDEWQVGERKADEYIAAGNVQEFNTIEEFLKSLKSEKDIPELPEEEHDNKS